MEIISLAGTSFDTIFGAFSKAFADYELQLNREQLRKMLTRRGFDPALSFAAFDNGQIVAFTLNGTGNYGGQPTAYDTGTGTLKEYRGQGLATKVFEFSIPFLKKGGISQCLLEVLQHNTGAVSVYRKLGFEVTREFYYFNAKNGSVNNSPKPCEDITLRHINIDDLEIPEGFTDFDPSWQNSMESVKRAPGEFIALGAFCGDKLLGYSVFEPASGDITQLAVDRDHRREGIGSILLAEMVRLNHNDTVKVINTDISCDAITSFLEAKNIYVAGKQFEMIKSI